MIDGQGLRLAFAGSRLRHGRSIRLDPRHQGVLFEVSATDPAAFVAVAALFLAVALPAAYLPAPRAMRIDPASALR